VTFLARSAGRFHLEQLGFALNRLPPLTSFRRGASLAEKLQNVMAVTEAPSKFWQEF
jgi:hypothetical protein